MAILNGLTTCAGSDDIGNESSVSGASVSAALDTLDGARPTTATAIVPMQVALLDKNQKNLNIHAIGNFMSLVSGGAVSSGSPQAVTCGITKLFIVVNAGSDYDGTLTVTGDTVNRNTGAVTSSDTEDITIDTLTTDSSDTDAESNARYAFTNGYSTTKWFMGSVSLSSSDLNLSDIDVYAVAFEQFDDQAGTTLDAFDATFTITNTAAWFYAYVYKYAPNTTTKKCDITREISLALAVGDSEADVPYRLRRGSLSVAIDGTHEGVWIDVFFGPDTQTYFENVNIKLWYQQSFALA